jgi:hypothetical protein
LEDELSNAEIEVRKGELLMDLIEKKLDFIIKNPPKREAPGASTPSNAQSAAPSVPAGGQPSGAAIPPPPPG